MRITFDLEPLNSESFHIVYLTKSIIIKSMPFCVYILKVCGKEILPHTWMYIILLIHLCHELQDQQLKVKQFTIISMHVHSFIPICQYLWCIGHYQACMKMIEVIANYWRMDEWIKWSNTCNCPFNSFKNSQNHSTFNQCIIFFFRKKAEVVPS